MVVLSSIVTRTGDDGTTALGDFSRVPKIDARIGAYAAVDELGALLGVLVAREDVPPLILSCVQGVQNDLFDVGADLCTPLGSTDSALRITADWVEALEEDCAVFGEELPTLRSFVLAGGTPVAALLHQARTVARRAEREVWAALDVYGSQPAAKGTAGGINPLTATYLNRLSDLLFILARAANAGADVLWEPGRRAKAAN